MKTHRLLIALTALLLTAVPFQSSAADVSVDISSFAPRNPDAILTQIELNVLLKQYQKLLTQIEDAALQRELENESIPSDATEDQKKQAEERHVKQNKDRDRESRALQDRAHQCRSRIKEIMSDANKRAAAIEKEQREAKPTTGQSQPNVGTLTLTGKSDDVIGGSIVPEEVDWSQATQTGTLRVSGEALNSGGTLMLKGSDKGTTPPKAPENAPSPVAK